MDSSKQSFPDADEVDRRDRQMAALYELWRAVPHTAVDRLLQMLAERATEAFDAHSCSLLLRELGGDEMRVAASVGLARDVAESARLLIGERIAGRVAATGQPALINNDPRAHPLLTRVAEGDESASELEARPEVASALCAPLVAADGDVLGVLCLSRLRPGVPFTEKDLRVFSLFAAQAGSVIAQVRTGANLARRGRELDALAQVADAVRAGLPEDALLRQLAEGVQEVIGFERCLLWRRVPEGDGGGGVWELAVGRGYRRGGGPSAAGGRVDFPGCLAGVAGPVFLADLAREHPDADAFGRALGVRSAVVAPLRVRGATEAVVLADIAPAGERVVVEMAETLGLFVDHVSAAVENARLFADLERAGREAAAMERRVARNAHLAELGQLAATVAHELRNPLSSIKGAAQFLLAECASDGDDPLVRDFLSIVVDEVDGLGRLTTDLLEWARPPTPCRERRDLVEVVRAEVEFLRSELEAQHITVREDYDDAASPVWADVDAAQIGRALRNLILNAAQAMGQDGTLAVAVCRTAGGGSELTVDDTGPGIPDAVLARLWEPFFTTKAKGTGLGLAQVRQVTEAHGGVIDAGPAPGGGACFTLRLPPPVPDDESSTESEKEHIHA